MSSPEQPPRPIQLLLGNRAAMRENFGLDVSYTPPSPRHYPHRFLWDLCFTTIEFARYDHINHAIQDLVAILKGQDLETGFIPNMQFAPKGRKFDPERIFFMHPGKHSDYSQPPVLALAAYEIYQAFLRENQEKEGKFFLESIYDNLKLFYEYFVCYRQNSLDDKKIGNIYPHETGRDSDPTFDFFKVRLRRRGPSTPRSVDQLNRILDYGSALGLSYRLRLKKWDLEKARKIFWVNDVMFNCIYVDNLYKMSEIAFVLGKNQDEADFKTLAAEVEERILTDMWFEDKEQGMFYALKPDGPIKVVSVSNLFPLILPHLRENQLEALLFLLEDPQWFNRPYPIPSVPANNPNYDPHHQEKDRLWRGPTWINMNWYLVERGLRMQADRFETSRPDLVNRCQILSESITAKTKELIERGYYEYYDPETGQPQRVDKTENFAWSTLGDIL